MTEPYQGIESTRHAARLTGEAQEVSSWPRFAHSQLATLLDSFVGPSTDRSLGSQVEAGLNFSQALDRLSPEHRRILEQNLPRAFIREARDLSREADPELFFEGWLHLALRHRQTRPDLSLACLSLLQAALAEDFSGRPANSDALLARVQRESEAIEGRGEVGSRVEFLAGHFVREASSPVALASMAVAGLVFSTVRTGLLARLLTGPSGAFTRGWGARATASTFAFGAEVPAFVFSGRALHSLGGTTQDWSAAALGRDLAMAGVTLGFLKLGGAGAQSLTRRYAAGGGLFQRSTRMILPQAAMFTGILAAHRAEQALGLRPEIDGGTTFVDSLATLLQFHVAGRLISQGMGPRYSALQAELHARSERLAATPRGFGFPRMEGVISPMGLALAGPRATSIHLDPKLRDVLMMAGDNGEGKPPSPPPPNFPTRPSLRPEGEAGEPRRPTAIKPAGGSLAERVAQEARQKVPPIVSGTRLGPGPEGRFEVQQELGQGGAGKVYRVVDTRSGRQAVIKVPKGRTDPQTLLRIEREIRITENLASGWAAPIYDHFEWPPGSGVLIPVMEYVDGRNFAEILADVGQTQAIARRDYPLPRRIDLFADLCLGVHDAHTHGVSHNDLKPENIMIDRNGRMRILDWGLARHFTQAESQSGEGNGRPVSGPISRGGHSEINGTPGYVPPEVFLGNKSSNPRVRDTFALGVILFETATGLHPFGAFREGDTGKGEPSLVPEWEVIGSSRYHRIPPEVALMYSAEEGMEPPAFRRILQGEFPPYLAEIESIARRAMHRNPEERFQSAADLREAVLMARARADRESLNLLQRQRQELEKQVTESWDWRIFNVVSRANPANWVQGEKNLHRLREMRDSWREGVNDLVIRLYEATKYEQIADARQMIAEISWERWIDGGDRMARGERERLEQRIRDNDFELPSGRMFSEVLGGSAAIELKPRSADPELEVNPKIRVIPWEREIDGSGQETANYRPGETLFEGLLSELQGRLELPAGYYAFEFYEPGFAPIQVPVQVSRRAVREAIAWRRPVTLDLTLIPRERVPIGMEVVHGGTSYTGLDFYHDGMPSNVYSFPMRRIQLPTFAISRDKVTVGEYSEFIRDLLDQGKVAEALEYMPRKRPVPTRNGALTATEVIRIFREEESSDARVFYWRVVPVFGSQEGFRYRLVDPTTHLDPNGDPIHFDQPISAIPREGAEAYTHWRAQRDGFPYRLPTAEEMEKVNRNSFAWTYPWGYDFSPFHVISRLTFQGDLNQTAFPQPIARHPMGEQFYRDFTIYKTRENLGNVRDITSSEGEPGTVVLSGGSVRVPYGPFYLPAGRNYPLQNRQVADSIGSFRLALDLSSP